MDIGIDYSMDCILCHCCMLEYTHIVRHPSMCPVDIRTHKYRGSTPYHLCTQFAEAHTINLSMPYYPNIDML